MQTVEVTVRIKDDGGTNDGALQYVPIKELKDMIERCNPPAGISVKVIRTVVVK